jgi:hypothetical protein
MPAGLLFETAGTKAAPFRLPALFQVDDDGTRQNLFHSLFPWLEP